MVRNELIFRAVYMPQGDTAAGASGPGVKLFEKSMEQGSYLTAAEAGQLCDAIHGAFGAAAGAVRLSSDENSEVLEEREACARVIRQIGAWLAPMLAGSDAAVAARRIDEALFSLRQGLHR